MVGARDVALLRDGAACRRRAYDPASALDIPAFDSASLRMAITSASPGDTITFLRDITLDADLPAVQTSITIDGAGNTLSGKFMGTVLFRGFFIGAWRKARQPRCR